MICASFVLARESKIDQFDIFMLIEKNILEFKIAVYAGLLVDVRDSSNKLCEDFLDFINWERTVFEEVIVELGSRAIFQDKPDEVLGDNDFVESRDVRVDELSVVVDFASEVGVTLVGGF